MVTSTEKRLFSERLKELCQEKGLPERGRQATLKRVCGLSQQSVSKWFNAEAIPEYEHCLKLCKYFSVNYEWLLTGNGIKRQKDVTDDDFMQENFGRTKETMTMAESKRVKEFLTLDTKQQIKAIKLIKEDQTAGNEESGKGNKGK